MILPCDCECERHLWLNCFNRQDSEQMPEPSVLSSTHICAEIFCAKFSRYRNLARMAGMRPTLVFISHHADLTEDSRGDNQGGQVFDFGGSWYRS